MEKYDNSGVLFKNDKGDNPKRPDYRGSIAVAGVDYNISGWIRESKKTGDKFMSLKVEAKDAFKAAVQALKVQPTRRQRLLAEMAREAHVRDRDVARALAAGGIGRLHLLQAYRHVPLLAETPARVVLRMARTLGW